MNILSIETSCDETSVAVVKDGRFVLGSSTATSIALHRKTGGIIPENAARKQVEYIIPTLEDCIKNVISKDNLSLSPQSFIKEKIDAIAVTVGPGLIGSLLVGVETAKTLSYVFEKPLVPVNHLKGHIYSVFLENESPPSFPLLAAIVSGGHSDFIWMEGHNKYKWLGGTRDDAAGECFDKCARLIGVGYPGGPAISKASEEYKKSKDFEGFNTLNLFPRPLSKEKNYDLSFSGLKTAVSNFIKTNSHFSKEKLSAEIEEAIVQSLLVKIKLIIKQKGPRSVIVCGGVSANNRLRGSLGEYAKRAEMSAISLYVPKLSFSGDNAAMIGSAAFFEYFPKSVFFVEANPELHFN